MFWRLNKPQDYLDQLMGKIFIIEVQQSQLFSALALLLSNIKSVWLQISGTNLRYSQFDRCWHDTIENEILGV